MDDILLFDRRTGPRRARTLAVAALLVAALVRASSAVAAGGHGAAGDGGAGDGGDPRDVSAGRDSEDHARSFEEEIVVSGRLDERVDPTRDVDRLDGDDARARGVASLPEWLAEQADVVAVDQVGNGRQLSLDLMGFAGASGATAVLLDGLRLDDPETGRAALELVPLIDVDRVELERGPAGALLGGGAAAGVVRVVTRGASREPSLESRAVAGSHGRRELSARATGPAGRRLAVAGSAHAAEGDGFREGADFRERGGRFVIGASLGEGEAELALSAFDGRWRHPSSLTGEQLADSPWQAPHARLDFQRSEQRLARLALDHDGERHRLSLIAHALTRSGRTLTTGRSGFGFLTEEDTRSLGFALESARELAPRGVAIDATLDATLDVRWGVEVGVDRFLPVGHATGATAGVPHPEGLETFAISQARVDWRRGAAFGGVALELASGLVIDAAARADWIDVRREGRERFGTQEWESVEGGRSFSSLTGSLGVAGRHAGRAHLVTWRARFGTAFVAPTAVQLFAFPGFGSNADLVPQRGLGATAGLSWEARRARLEADVSWTRVTDEIVYDEGARKNLNAARTRRLGASLDLELELGSRARLSLGAAWSDATFREGWSAGAADPDEIVGRPVPLVPSHAATLRLTLGPWSDRAAVRLDLVARHVGETAVGDDFDSSQPPTASRSPVDLTLRGGCDLRRARIEWAIALTNVLDRVHVVRSIEAFDPLSTDPSAGASVFHVPGPPRALSASLALQF